MDDINVLFDKKVKRLFGNDPLYNEVIFNSIYLEDFFELDNSIEKNDIISFMNKYECYLINNLLNNEEYKDQLLRKDGIIYRTMVDKIDIKYLRNIFDNIRRGIYGSAEINTVLEIIKFINLYGLDNRYTQLILKNNINLIVYNENLVSDENTEISVEEKNAKTNTLLLWSSRCGNGILDRIFLLELLYERIRKLILSEREELNEYKPKLKEMLDICLMAIKLRDNSICVDDNVVKKINNLFSDYDYINKQAMIKCLNNEDYKLVHFVPINEVDYQFVNGKIEDVAKKVPLSADNIYDDPKQDEFIKSFIEKCKKDIEKRYPISIKIFKNFYNKKLAKYLLYYNDIFNKFPLTRLSINTTYINSYFDECLEKANNRLSCSLISDNFISSHLQRTVGLSVVPIDGESIIEIGRGYINRDYYNNFRRNAIPYIDVISSLENKNRVNETVLDATKCTVKSVIVTSDDPNSLMRAEHLSQAYGVPIEYHLENYKGMHV